MRLTVVMVLAIATAYSIGRAQTPTPVDRGTLVGTNMTPMGERTTSEEFTIVRNADGGFTVSTVTTEGLSRHMRSVLTTDAAGVPTAYEHSGGGGESLMKTITSKRVDGALVISEQSSRNPPFAPYRFPASTLVFGDGGLAHAWLLSLGSVPRDVAYLETGLWREAKARVTDAGKDSVTIEGSVIAATHLVLSGGLFQREVWLDSEKRLLKVARGSNFSATRTKRPQ
jgi:hypothetical protein